MTMRDINLFPGIPLIAVFFFFYGIVFLFLGVSVAARDTKASELRFAKNLWLLSGFGFTHGTHEWLELYIILQGKYMSGYEALFIRLVEFFLIIASFILLLQFGVSLIRSFYGKRAGWLKLVPIFFFIVWLLLIWQGLPQSYNLIENAQLLKRADGLGRHIFGLPGGFITAYGLARYSREVRMLDTSVSKTFLNCGIVFIFYSIFAGLIPSHTALPYLFIPIEALRGIAAGLITCYIIKAMRIFDIEAMRKTAHQLQSLAQSEKFVSLGQLAAGIAHEINTPLTNASLNLQMLKKRITVSELDKETLFKLEGAERNIERAATITKELLNYSRKGESEFVPVSISEVINSALTLLNHKLKDIISSKKPGGCP